MGLASLSSLEDARPLSTAFIVTHTCMSSISRCEAKVLPLSCRPHVGSRFFAFPRLDRRPIGLAEFVYLLCLGLLDFVYWLSSFVRDSCLPLLEGVSPWFDSAPSACCNRLRRHH